MFSPDGTALAREASWMARALHDDAPYGEKEIIIGRPDGSHRTVLSYVTPVHDADGKLVAATAVLIDVTQHAEARNAARTALRASEANFRAFFDSKAIGVVQVDAAGLFVRVNDRYCELTGYSSELAIAIVDSDAQTGRVDLHDSDGLTVEECSEVRFARAQSRSRRVPRFGVLRDVDEHRRRRNELAVGVVDRRH